MPSADFHSSDATYKAYAGTLAAWVMSAGGWPMTNDIRFSVESGSHQATILTGLRINLVSRARLISKTVLSLDECGGAAPPHPFSVDFDTTPPRIKALPGETTDPTGNTITTAPVSFPFTVSETDPQIFDLRIEHGPICDCLWTATLSYTQSGHSYTTVIDNNGAPFHAVPADHVPAYKLVNGVLEVK